MQNSPSAERLEGDIGGGVSVIGVLCGVTMGPRPPRDPTAPVGVGTHGWVAQGSQGCERPPQRAHGLF